MITLFTSIHLTPCSVNNYKQFKNLFPVTACCKPWHICTTTVSVHHQLQDNSGTPCKLKYTFRTTMEPICKASGFCISFMLKLMTIILCLEHLWGYGHTLRRQLCGRKFLGIQQNLQYGECGCNHVLIWWHLFKDVFRHSIICTHIRNYTWSTYDRPHLRPSPTSIQEHDPDMYCTISLRKR
jgi:hypothetical protein